MLTRCPHCETTFRVTSEQLKVRQGSVRCGSCREVFNALESLADEVSGSLGHEPAPVAGMDLAPATEAEQELPAVQLAEAEEPEPEPEQDEASPPEPADEALADEAVWEDQPAPRRWPWALGLAALLLLAAAQLVYVFRVEIAVLSPGLRPALVATCDLAGCVVPLPRKPELLGIETSDLAPAEGEHLLLTATLKNRAPFVQEYPHLELALTDTQDAALLRKVLTPADYLPAGLSPAGGFAARGELAVKLNFEARGVPAIGYRLYLFYP
jgi:predicted Zn finger-like uncharacterized protein